MLDNKGLMTELGSRLGISLNFEENGMCQILFDDDAVDFEQSENALYLIGEVGSIPPESRTSLYERLLRANYLGSETGNATLSLDPNKEGAILLHRRLETPMPYADFEGALELFVKALRYWKERIALPCDTPATGTESENLSMLRV